MHQTQATADPRAEAESRIANALRAKAKVLDLSDLGLKIVPDSLGKLSRVTNLDLSGNHLTEFPAALRKAPNLRWLNLSRNQLTELSDDLNQLPTLQWLSLSRNHLRGEALNAIQSPTLTWLDLSGNALRELPDCLDQLPSLVGLNLRGNELTQLPDSIGGMASLRRLDLGENQLTELPASFQDLEALQELDLRQNQLQDFTLGSIPSLNLLNLSGNELTEFPSKLSELRSLKQLKLSENRIGQIGDEISDLRNLQRLDLSNNAIRELPPSFGNLRNLQQLDLSDNELQQLPEAVLKLYQLSHFFLHRNPGLELPREVLGPEPEEVFTEEHKGAEPANPSHILAYYFEALEGRPLNEVKLLLVGRGGAGKSSMRDQLLDREFDPDMRETPGIDIDLWEIPQAGAEPITAHIWDFAGQEITHATHQFFLTERSVYVLVIEGRQDTQEQDAEYWLKLIAGFGKDSPVIICLNKFAIKEFGINGFLLRQKYPAIRKIIRTDCSTGMGIEELKEEIFAAIDSIDEVRFKFPANWWIAKEHFANMEEDYLHLKDYRKVCARCSLTDPHKQNQLVRHLHQLGILLHYGDDDRLRETTVLNPHWVTESIYRLLRLKEGQDSDGSLTLIEADAALERDDTEMVRFLIELMRKFELCFPVAGSEEIWLVPELLPHDPDEVPNQWNGDDVLRLRYDYTVLPEGLIPRFITRTYPMSNGRLRWRYGVVLGMDSAEALVWADPVESQVLVAIVSQSVEDRERLAKVIRHHFGYINAAFGGLKPQEMIEVSGHMGYYKRVNTLLKDERSGAVSTIETDEGSVELNQTVELNRITSEEARRSGADPLRVFISYAHKDRDAYDILSSSILPVFEADKLVRMWSDRQIPPGRRWDELIRRELEDADVVVFLVSWAFLTSSYIQGRELEMAVQLERKGRLRVVPIPIEDCPWQESTLHQFQSLLADGKPIRDYSPNLEDGFKKVGMDLHRLLVDIRREKVEAANKKSVLSRLGLGKGGGH